MDVFDSPLNLAHQQGRKADALVESANFDGAVKCHEKAAELLSEALETTTVPQVKESLVLQHKQHLQQIKVVRGKEQEHRVKQTQQRKITAGQNSKRSSQADLEDNLAHKDANNHKDHVDGPCKMHISRRMQEYDTFLQFLNDRSGTSIGVHYKPPQRNANNLANKHMVESAIKAPKDNAQIIEELEVQNENLRQHIMNLLDENDLQKSQLKILRAEKKQLQAQNRELSKKLSPQGLSESADDYCETMPSLEDLTTMELPPLEMPTFDFQDPFSMRREDAM